jgi:hypothetical protein
MKTLIAASLLLVLIVPAHAVDPYKEGIRDYRRGLCFHSRPDMVSPSDEALWIRGYEYAGGKNLWHKARACRGPQSWEKWKPGGAKNG